MTTLETPAPTTTTPVTRRDVLHRAADLLEEFGWGQGCEIDAEPFLLRYEGIAAEAKPGPFCVGTAVQEAAAEYGILIDRSTDLRFAEISNAVVHALGLQTPRGIAGWNDEPGRTKAEVVARLRAAAESE